jgi:hypothetical protein
VNLSDTLRRRYRTTISLATDSVVIWAAERVAKQHGRQVALRELERVNYVRERLGRTLAEPEPGSMLGGHGE